MFRLTQLGQSRYVNIGWILNFHQEYSNQEMTREDLQTRTGGKNWNSSWYHISPLTLQVEGQKLPQSLSRFGGL